MTLLNRLKNLIPLDHPVRIFYHTLRAILAACVFLFPANRMIVIGVTGTDGKTTTCNMITTILQKAGHKVGMISTVLCRISDHVWMNETKMTSLDPFLMNSYLWQMRKAGCQYVVLEVSSHAILYNRIWGVNVDIAVMTHISSDHLDLHKTIRNYVDTKKKLFTNLNYYARKPNIPKVIVLNSDDHYFQEFNEVVSDKKYTYGIHNPSQLNAIQLEGTTTDISFSVKLANILEKIRIPIPGTFNVMNALAALAVGLSQGISLDTMKDALASFSVVPGRMEKIEEGQPFAVIIDYAHTEDALKKVLSTLKGAVQGKLIHVFGATGDRDRTKRPKMGELSHKYADMILVTDDDPYTEERMHIIREVVQGIPRSEGDDFWIIPNRKQAIKTAVYLAEKGDLVLITGKGAEQVLVMNNGKIPWDDRVIARDYLKRRYEGLIDKV